MIKHWRKKIIAFVFVSVLIICTILGSMGCEYKKRKVNNTDPLYVSDSGQSFADKYDGNYYFSNGSLMYMYMSGEERAIPLCNRPDCSHGGKSLDETVQCNAWCDNNGFACVAGNIYFTGNNGYSTSLYEMRIDGSGSEKLSDLYVYEDSEADDNIGNINYAYSSTHCYYSRGSYNEEGEYHLVVMRLKLEKGASPELFVKIPCDGTIRDVVNLLVCDDCLIISCYDDNGTRNIYLADMEDKKITQTIDGAHKAYIYEDQLYYLIPDLGVYKSARDGENAKLLIPLNADNLIFGMDEDYIYIDWSRNDGLPDYGQEGNAFIELYSHDGDKKGKFDTGFVFDPMQRAYLGSDLEYIFIGEASLFVYEVHALEKSKIFEKTSSWKKILDYPAWAVQ